MSKPNYIIHSFEIVAIKSGKQHFVVWYFQRAADCANRLSSIYVYFVALQMSSHRTWLIKKFSETHHHVVWNSNMSDTSKQLEHISIANCIQLIISSFSSLHAAFAALWHRCGIGSRDPRIHPSYPVIPEHLHPSWPNVGVVIVFQTKIAHMAHGWRSTHAIEDDGSSPRFRISTGRWFHINSTH